MGRQPLKQCVHIGGILADLLRVHQRTFGKELTRISELWDDTVGGQIAQNAKPVAYKQKLLSVSVTSSVWMQQLQFLKADMIARLNKGLGGKVVTDIKFKIGR